MSLVALSIEKKTVSYFLAILMAVAGVSSFFSLGWLEDPEFTVKTAAITTLYPGASAKEVELEVTDRIELKLQEMQEVKKIYSESRPGLSIIKVDIKDQIWSEKLPQTWDVLRKKIGDIRNTLPSGAHDPSVSDDFGYVFGFLLAITGDGFSYKELEQYVNQLRKELSLVEGVARIDLWGVQDKRIYIDATQSQISSLGITAADMQRALSQQNEVINAGHVDVQGERLRVSISGDFTAVDDIGELTVTASQAGARAKNELIRIKDIATVSQGYVEPARKLMRYNGTFSIAMALAPVSGTNVVGVGRAIDERIAELQGELPIGIEIKKVSWQSESVAASIKSFMINLAEAVIIVLIVLAVSMGLRVGIVVGVSGLVLAILGTFLIMSMMGIDLQRVSLGALIISMGMMVDNAIVVVDNFVIKLKQGVAREQAAIEAASAPSWPLLGATVIACMAFYPIYSSTASTGEYAGSLFTVVGISLMLSWVLSQTITPLMCIAMLPDPPPDGGKDAYDGRLYQTFRASLGAAIKYRFIFISSLVGLLIISFMGFGKVPILFFPDSSREQVMIDYWEPEGTRIEQVSANLKEIEEMLQNHEQVENVSTFIGSGPPRFYLPVSPESPHSSYAQLVVNTRTLEGVEQVIRDAQSWADKNYPQAHVRLRRYPVGSFNDWKFEARFSGPAEADIDTLISLAEHGTVILKENPSTKEVRSNWRQRTKLVVSDYNQAQGRWGGISRADIARATQRAVDGRVVGQYREGDNLIPIVFRNTDRERKQASSNLGQLLVSSPGATESIPLEQVTDSTYVAWEESLIWRYNRRRAITVQASPIDGVTTPDMRNAVLAQFEAIELPPGYSLDWGGEFDSSKESQDGLKPGGIPALVIMVLIIIMLFNSYRPALIIFMVIPFALIGIVSGLLLTQTPFGFMAVLGAMSLSGMMIKNSIVLLDQIKANLDEGIAPYKAVVEAAISRLSPVINAAATTVLGMAPLLQDGFWVSMAVTIMFGLAFGTVLTMFAVPVLYAIFYKVSKPEVIR